MTTTFDDGVMRLLLRAVLEMEESVTYQEILAEGVAEGERRAARRIIFLQGQEKFGEPSAEVRGTIEGMTDLDRLEALEMRLFRVDSWQALLQEPPFISCPTAPASTP